MKHNLAIYSPHSESLDDQEEIAKFLLVAPKTMEAWRSRGGGPPYVRVGRLIRYRKSSVVAWLKSREVSSTSETTR